MLCNVIISDVVRLVVRDSDMDSEDVSLIQSSVSEGQRKCSSKGVLSIGVH